MTTPTVAEAVKLQTLELVGELRATTARLDAALRGDPLPASENVERPRRPEGDR